MSRKGILADSIKGFDSPNSWVLTRLLEVSLDFVWIRK